MFGIAVSILGVYRVFVLPSYESLFAGIGVALPGETRFLISKLPDLLPAAFTVWAVCTGLCLALVYSGYRRVDRLMPLPGWALRLPVIGTLAKVYSDGLFVHFARMLRSHGIDDVAAVRLASASAAGNRRYVDILGGNPPYRLGTPLDNLRAPRRWGTSISSSTISAAILARRPLLLAKVRDRIAFVIKSTLFVIVGAIIYAMYLPMGAVI